MVAQLAEFEAICLLEDYATFELKMMLQKKHVKRNCTVSHGHTIYINNREFVPVVQQGVGGLAPASPIIHI